MVELALPRALHALGQRAVREAVARRAGTVEAEHLLLAILDQPSEPAAIALAGGGLDYGSLAAALDAERSRSLGVTGVVTPSATSLTATRRWATPGWGASIRDVLRNANKPAAKDGRPGALAIELCVSILDVPLGTVARAIAIAGLDRVSLISVLRKRTGT